MTDEARRFPLFPQWEQDHAGEVAERSKYPPRLLKMWAVHGRAAEGVTCKTCCHCLPFDYHNKRYYKCDQFKITNGAGTDWRIRWPACGKHQACR